MPTKWRLQSRTGLQPEPILIILLQPVDIKSWLSSHKTPHSDGGNDKTHTWMGGVRWLLSFTSRVSLTFKNQDENSGVILKCFFSRSDRPFESSAPEKSWLKGSRPWPFQKLIICLLLITASIILKHLTLLNSYHKLLIPLKLPMKCWQWFCHVVDFQY